MEGHTTVTGCASKIVNLSGPWLVCINFNYIWYVWKIKFDFLDFVK